VLLLAGLAALGDSAAVVGLGPRTGSPPWDLAAGPTSGLVTVLGLTAYLLGALSVWWGLRALAAGARMPWRRAVAAAVAAVGLLVVVPPVGSADHLSYLAYGRIAAAGDDAYSVAPSQWRDGQDTVAGAVQPPWQDTPSVYGPVATAVFAGVAAAGDGSLRTSVWLWQLLCGTAFLVVGAVLFAAVRGRAARDRVLVLWALNPVLLGQLVLGAHVDVVVAALAVAGVLLAVRAPVAAGVLLGAAAGMKAPYVLAGLAALWSVRSLPRPRLVATVGAGALGALVVLVPSYWWAGPQVWDQLGRASRMTSLATPWRAVANLIDLGFGSGAGRAVAVPLSFVVAAGLVWLLRRSVGRMPVSVPGLPGEGLRAFLVLAVAWVLSAPYALPWYDAMVWAPLAVVGASWVDGVLLLRLLVLSLAYVPGRVVGMSGIVEGMTLAGRRYVAPVLGLGILVFVVLRSRIADGPPDRTPS
jgi:hypothetical protein